MSMTLMRLLPAIALAAVLTGCGDDTSGEDPGSTPAADRPAPGDYLGTDLPAPFGPDDVLRLNVTDDGISFSATCNNFMGNATWTDGTLRTGALGGTQMGCEPEAMAQDEWLTDLFAGAPEFAVDGTGFTLSHDDVTLVLRPRVEVEPDLPLEGTDWTLDGLGSGGDDGAMSSVPAGVRSTLRIDDGRMTLELPCNGKPQPAVEVSDAELVVDGYATTKMSCGEDADSVESAVTLTLQGTVGYEIEAGRLTLTGADGGVLTYVAE